MGKNEKSENEKEKKEEKIKKSKAEKNKSKKDKVKKKTEVEKQETTNDEDSEKNKKEKPETKPIAKKGNIVEDIEISSEVITTIAGVAVSEVEGVETATGFLKNISGALKNKRKESRGIKVEVNNNNVDLDINIIVDYGKRIPELAFDIQTKVKKSVEAMTGLKVKEVNVHVQGLKKPEGTEKGAKNENNR